MEDEQMEELLKEIYSIIKEGSEVEKAVFLERLQELVKTFK